CKNIVLRNYIYKGHEVAVAVKNSLNNFVYNADNYRNLHQLTFEKCGYGATAFLVALLHPDIQITASDSEEYISVACNCRELPANLSFEVCR
nr:hypothetical protein [Bacteroidales bacterium]